MLPSYAPTFHRSLLAVHVPIVTEDISILARVAIQRMPYSMHNVWIVVFHVCVRRMFFRPVTVNRYETL